VTNWEEVFYLHKDIKGATGAGSVKKPCITGQWPLYKAGISLHLVMYVKHPHPLLLSDCCLFKKYFSP